MFATPAQPGTGGIRYATSEVKERLLRIIRTRSPWYHREVFEAERNAASTVNYETCVATARAVPSVLATLATRWYDSSRSVCS